MSTQQRRSARRDRKPQLLVASPHIRGTPFDRQVVLVLEHSSRGSTGVVLTEQFRESLRLAHQNLVQQNRLPQNRLPQNRLPQNETPQDETPQHEMQQMMGSVPDEPGSVPPGWVAISVGVVHWGPGQLAEELRQGVWMTSPAKVDSLSDRQDDLWVNLVRTIGRSVLRDVLKIRQMPADPTVN